MLKIVVAEEWRHSLLFRNGRFVRVLTPGAHWLWGLDHFTTVDLPKHGFAFGPVQDALTADGFPLRVAGSLAYEVVEAKAAFDGQLERVAPLLLGEALAATVAGRPLDALVSDRAGLSAEVNAALGDRLPGATATDIFVTSLVFPPEVRRMLTEAERARREGLAALERARAEQASLRALANAARLLKNSPELMNLRLLQSVGGGGKGATLVLGESGLAKLSGGAPASAEATDDVN